MKKFAFDLDGTITRMETLPILAKELGLSKELKHLTDLTLSGEIPFRRSFALRYLILKSISPSRIRSIMETVELNKDIANFIRDNKTDCAIVTGNLDYWIEPIIAKLGCESYSSTSRLDEDGNITLDKILDKSSAIRNMKKTAEKVIAIGESFNDVPMFEEADISVAYAGVHRPVDMALSVSDYVVFDGHSLCQLLRTL